MSKDFERQIAQVRQVRSLRVRARLKEQRLAAEAGLGFAHIDYPLAGPAVLDLMGGNIDIFITTPPGVILRMVSLPGSAT